MMRINNRGFTLVESLMTLAIITVVSTMIILGIANIVTLFSEGAMIKNETNELYNDLVAGNNVTTGDTSGMTSLYFGTSESNKATLKVNEYYKSSDDSFNIKLRYLDPVTKAQKLPGTTEDEDDTIGDIDGNFYILSNAFGLPNTFKESSKYALDYYTRVHDKENDIKGLFKKDIVNAMKYENGTDMFSMFGLNSVNRFLAIEINNDLLKKSYSKLPDTYKNLFQLTESNYRLVYASIQKARGDGGGGDWVYDLYAYLIPKQPGVFLKYFDNKGMYNFPSVAWLPIVNNKVQLPDNFNLGSALKVINANGDPIEYSVSDFINCKFIGAGSQSGDSYGGYDVASYNYSTNQN